MLEPQHYFVKYRHPLLLLKRLQISTVETRTTCLFSAKQTLLVWYETVTLESS